MEEVLEGMRRAPGDAEVQRAGCALVAKEGANDLEKLMRWGAAERVVAAMRNHVGLVEVIREGCEALSVLARRDENRAALMKLDAADVIMKAMIKHGDDGGVCLNGCGAFCNLALNADNKVPLMKMGAADIIIKVMIKHADNAGVCQLGCAALWSLAFNAENKVTLMKMSVADVIVKAMITHADNAEVCRLGCGALGNLWYKHAANKTVMVKKEVADSIITAMINHTDHAGMCECGCGALWNLSADNANNQAILVKMGAADAIMKAMTIHADNAGVCEKGFGALYNLLLQKELRMELCQQGVVSVLENALGNHPSSANIQKWGKKALENAREGIAGASASIAGMKFFETGKKMIEKAVAMSIKNLQISDEYVLFSLIQQFDLTEYFGENAKMEKENAKTKIIAMMFDLAVMNQQHEILLKSLKELMVSMPLKGFERRMIAERQTLDDVEKKISEGRKDLGGKRDGHRENVIEIANKLTSEDVGISTKKKQLFDLELKMKQMVDEIEGTRDNISGSSASTSEWNGNDFRVAQPQLKTQLFSVPDPENKVLIDNEWMDELRYDAASIRKEVEDLSAAVSKLGNKMSDLFKRMSPMIENVLNQTHSLVERCKEAVSEHEQRLLAIDVKKIVPDIEKQIELHKQRKKIQVHQNELEKIKNDIHNEEIKMAEVNLEQQKGSAVVSSKLLGEINIKLNHLKSHHDELIESITELCHDHSDPSICRFPDLMPPQPSVDPNKSLFRVPRFLKIRSRYYIIREQLGAGGFAQVFRAMYQKPGQVIEIQAFKKLPGMQLGDREASVISDEIEILAALDHPNIIKLLGVSDDPESVDGNRKNLGIGIAMEYCENGSLRKYLDHTPHPNMDIVIRILVDVAEGMKYLHQHKPNAIIHCDLKSDNILLDKDMNAKICDFGIAKIIEATTAKGRTTTAGTAQYKAPESYDGMFEPCSDVYSFGCVMYEALSGMRPWERLNDMQIMKNILKKKSLDFSKLREDASAEFVALMKQCLDYDKNKRSSFVGINTELNKLIPPVVLIKVDPSSDEFGAIENRFFSPNGKGRLSRSQFRIVEITKVRNGFTESLFESERAGMKIQMKSEDVNERLMFHGTRETDPVEVVKNRHGMMRDFTDRDDLLYGKGIYFAEFARYSHTGFAHENGNGQFQMLLCSVLCGNSFDMGIQTDSTLRQREFSKRAELKDKHSILAGPHRPSWAGPGENDSRMVVVFKDSQCTPRYIITYESV